MTISASSWVNFVNKLTAIDDAATKKVADYINLYGGSFSFDNAGHMKALIEYSLQYHKYMARRRLNWLVKCTTRLEQVNSCYLIALFPVNPRRMPRLQRP